MHMKRKKKMWIARDMDDQLRVYTKKPYWKDGYWTSACPNWQIDYTEFSDLSKGELRLVKMEYRFLEDE